MVAYLLSYENVVRIYLHLFARRRVSYLRYLCLLVNSGVQRILCCVFVVFLFVLPLCCQNKTRAFLQTSGGKYEQRFHMITDMPPYVSPRHS
jgi:hypothetical protein